MNSTPTVKPKASSATPNASKSPKEREVPLLTDIYTPDTGLTLYNANITRLICDNIMRHPDKLAIITHDRKPITYFDLGTRISHYQVMLKELGIQSESNVLVLSRQEELFFPLILAMLASRVVPLIIDPAVNKRQIKKILGNHIIEAFFCSPEEKKRRFSMTELWRTPLYQISARGLLNKKGKKIELAFPLLPTSAPFLAEPCHTNNPAMVTYYPAYRGCSDPSSRAGLLKAESEVKGVVISHGKLISRYELKRRENLYKPADIQLSFDINTVIDDLCFGLTTVLPPLPSKPYQTVAGDALYKQLIITKTTRLQASLATTKALLNHLQKVNVKMPFLKTISIEHFGIPTDLIKRFRQRYPKIDINTYYHIPEADPISYFLPGGLINISGALGNYHPHRGFCVGKPYSDIKIKILNRLGLTRAPNRIGEIIISGPNVVDSYTDSSFNREQKFTDIKNNHWHKTGDKGCFDEKGNLWITGRVGCEITIIRQGKPIKIEPYPIEVAVNKTAGVKQAAIVQSSEKSPPMLFCELEKSISSKQALRLISRTIRQVAGLKPYVIIVDSLPLDEKDHAYIDRLALIKRGKSRV